MKKLALAFLAVLIVACFVPLASASTTPPKRLSLSNGGVGVATWTISVKQGTSMISIPITVVWSLPSFTFGGSWMYVVVDHLDGAGKAWAMGEAKFVAWGTRALVTALLKFDYGTGQSAWHTIEVTWDIDMSWASFLPGYQFLGTRSGISLWLYNGLMRGSFAGLTIDHGSPGGYFADEAYYVYGDFVEVFLP